MIFGKYGNMILTNMKKNYPYRKQELELTEELNLKIFEREKYNLKGQIKTVSNIACEYIITSDHEYFERIGEEETKRFFETAYKFVAEYKDLGEQYIMSAKVHMDEQTPHMHLVFLPVVHTTDKKGNSIDKLACSEFWKAKDSYRQLQDAFYKYMVENGFDLQRGLPKEETNREHYSVEEYNKKEFDMEWKYTNKINKLEKENNFLHKVVDRFKETIDIFIIWICKKFDMGAESNLIRDFERENNIMLDAEKQIKYEEREKGLEM